MKKTRFTPDVPNPYEAPDCTMLPVSPSGLLCASETAQNEGFDEIYHLFLLNKLTK